MKPDAKVGWSILTGGLAFVGAAGATDLVGNGSFEDPVGPPWVGNFQTYNTTNAFYTGPAIPASENPGDNYSWQHGLAPEDFTGPCIQDINLLLEVPAEEIDAGQGQFTFSAWMASYGNPGSNPDQPYLTLQFLDETNGVLGSSVVLDRVTGTSFVTFADGVTTFDSATHLHSWAKYLRTAPIPSRSRTARIGITHSPNAEFSGRPDTYVDLVKLDVVSTFEVLPPSVDSALPADRASGVRPDAKVLVTLRDGTTAVDPSSIQFFFDSAPVAPLVDKAGEVTTIEYDPPGSMAALSSHSYELIFSDDRQPATTQTNRFNFTVAPYYNLLLPEPIQLEAFDSTPEGQLPAGWTSVSFSAVPDPNFDLGDLNSASYANWTVVDSVRFLTPLLTYGAHDPTLDYQRVLFTNFVNVVNGQPVEQLASNRIAFGDSGYRDGGYQVIYLFSPDFDLTGHENVYLSFHSLWEQNQDSVASVEYSVDQGTTWLPLVYYIDRVDILRDGNGNVDPVATLSASQPDTAIYVDPDDGQQKGGYYGAFIGVASNQWSTLAPYLSGRVDDDPVESKRVEIFRLPAADNQATVRFRFAHAGADSWYFGLDNVGLYTITQATPPLVSITSTQIVEGVGNQVIVGSTILGVGPFSYQWKRDGADIPGQTNASLALNHAQFSDAGFYTLQVSFPGGSTVASGSQLTLINPAAPVIGQWDFEQQDLAASCGVPLDYFDFNVLVSTGFGDTDSAGVPRIEERNVSLMQFYAPTPSGGYKMLPGVPGNGGGTNLNQYTLIMDILYPAEADLQRRALLQTDPNNASDADFRINENNGIGVDGVYQGSFAPGTWHRIALAVDLTGPGPSPTVAKFINGVRVGTQTLPEGRDGRWSLQSASNTNSPYALLFADDDSEALSGYVSSIQLRSGRLSDSAIAQLGGPSAGKIPGCIRVELQSNTLTIRWSGEVPLQSADQITGPWADVADAVSPYTVGMPAGGRKFYRPKL